MQDDREQNDIDRNPWGGWTARIVKVAVWIWGATNVIGNLAGCISRASVDDSQRAFENIRFVIGGKTDFGLVVNCVLLVAVCWLIFQDARGRLRSIRAGRSLELILIGDPIRFPRRFHGCLFIGGLIVMTAGVGVSQSQSTWSALGWSALAGFGFFLITFLVSRATKTVPAANSASAGVAVAEAAKFKQERDDALELVRQKDTELEALRSKAASADLSPALETGK